MIRTFNYIAPFKTKLQGAEQRKVTNHTIQRNTHIKTHFKTHSIKAKRKKIYIKYTDSK